jgi:hypothetical protein
MPDSDPTPDEIAGMAWWDNLAEVGRTYWLEVAKGAVANPSPADAWDACKRVTGRGKQATQDHPSRIG